MANTALAEQRGRSTHILDILYFFFSLYIFETGLHTYTLASQKLSLDYNSRFRTNERLAGEYFFQQSEAHNRNRKTHKSATKAKKSKSQNKKKRTTAVHQPLLALNCWRAARYSSNLGLQPTHLHRENCFLMPLLSFRSVLSESGLFLSAGTVHPPPCFLGL